MQVESNPESEKQIQENTEPSDTAEFPWRIRLGTLLGLPLYFHISFFLWLFGLFWVDKTDLVLYISLIFFSVGVHEFAHAIACRYFGFGGGTLTIWLFGGFFLPYSELTLFEMTRKQRIEYALMHLAGPLANLVLAGFFISLGYITTMSHFQLAAQFNVAIALFNLLPAGRLDGGNIVIYLGTTVFNWRKIMIAVGILSFVAAAGIIVGVFYNNWLGNYSNTAGIFIGMGITSIRMSSRSEESIKSENIKFIQKEKILVERTQSPTLFGRGLTLGLTGMLIYSVGYLAFFYTAYHDMTGKVVYARLSGGYDQRKLYIVDGLGFPRVSAEGIPEDYLFHLSSSSDGKVIAFRCRASNPIYQEEGRASVCVNDSTGKLVAEIPLVGQFHMAGFSVSPDGRRVALSTNDDGVWILELNGMKKQKFYPEGGVNTWSPDGTSVLIVKAVDADFEIFRVELATGMSVNISNHPAKDFYPAYSNDGQKIYFVSNRDGGNQLFVMNFDGTNVSKIALQNPIYTRKSRMQISPDNRQIAFECGSIGGIICVANVDGSQERELVYGEYPAWSPDGKYLLYGSTYNKEGVFLIMLNGKYPIMLAPLRDWTSELTWLP